MSTLAGVLLFAVASPAGGASACWKTLINDWYDGRIDNVYPVACYEQALKHLPEDVQTYSSARDDIRAALQARILYGKKGNDNAIVPVGKNGGGPTGGGNGKGPNVGPTQGRRTGGGPVGDAIRQFGPKNADSIPIPLIVLASIALLLLAAGAAGFAARRIQARKVAVPARSPTPQK